MDVDEIRILMKEIGFGAGNRDEVIKIKEIINRNDFIGDVLAADPDFLDKAIIIHIVNLLSSHTRNVDEAIFILKRCMNVYVGFDRVASGVNSKTLYT
jgi:hypothetical protein